MGTEADLGFVQVDAIEARAFASRFDPFGPHIFGFPNEVLPEDSVSGLYVAMVAHGRLLTEPLASSLICGTDVRISFRRPVIAGETLSLEARWEDRVRATQSLGPVVERTTEILAKSHDAICLSYQIQHLLRPDD